MTLQIVLVPHVVNFNFPVWNEALAGFDRDAYIWNGINDGFDIGWLENAQPTYYENPTIPTVESQDIFITNWIVKCHKKGFLLGPFTASNCPFKNLIFAPLFTVLKPDFKQRIVCNLSHGSKDGNSVNDCINPSATSVRYISFKEVASFVHALGPNAYLWIVDAQDAYYRVPIKQKYWRYFAIKWFGFIFIFTSLQMGLSSACAIYQAFADSVLYIIKTKGAHLFVTVSGFCYIHHYLDDFFGGHPNEYIATLQCKFVVSIFALLGIPTQWKKVKLPNQVQKLLGWLYNTRLGTVSVPPDKVRAYIDLCSQLIHHYQNIGKKHLEHVVGCLQWTSPVVYPGKIRLRNLEHAMHLECFDYTDKITLSRQVIEDLRWWKYALKYMNGVPLTWIISDPSIYYEYCWTDATTKLGQGGCTSQGFAYQFYNHQTIAKATKQFRHGINIDLFELLALYIMARLRCQDWQYKNIYFYCDNSAAAYAVINQRAKLSRFDLNYIVRKFAELSAQFHFRFFVKHIPGEENEVADALSRYKTGYRKGTVDVSEFTFYDSKTAINIANEIFGALLNTKIVPLNDDDPKLFR